MTQKRAHIQMKQGRAGQVYVCVSYHKERRRGRERANEERVQRTFPTGKRLQRLQLDLLSVLGLCFCFPHWHSYQKTCVLGQRLNCILSRLFLVAKFECACNSPFTNSPFAIPPQKRQRIFFVDRYHALPSIEQLLLIEMPKLRLQLNCNRYKGSDRAKNKTEKKHRESNLYLFICTFMAINGRKAAPQAAGQSR